MSLVEYGVINANNMRHALTTQARAKDNGSCVFSGPVSWLEQFLLQQILSVNDSVVLTRIER